MINSQLVRCLLGMYISDNRWISAKELWQSVFLQSISALRTLGNESDIYSTSLQINTWPGFENQLISIPGFHDEFTSYYLQANSSCSAIGPWSIYIYSSLPSEFIPSSSGMSKWSPVKSTVNTQGHHGGGSHSGEGAL